MSGRPTSPNGASSFHLMWLLEPSDPLVEVSAVLEVVVPPAVEALYFWALQVSFLDGATPRGAAHVGLQWHPGHPGNTAVNWGGYGPGGDFLPGTDSTLPSGPDNPNTRDYAWMPGRPYRLRVSASPGIAGHWQGEFTDVLAAQSQPTVIRHLNSGADRLTTPLVWSEVFARCDDPSVSVRWSDFDAVTATGRHLTARRFYVSYQARTAGGCDNTTVHVDDRGVIQTTNAERRLAHGSVVDIARADRAT